MTVLTVEQRVAAGAAWLDVTDPAWLDDVNLDILRMDTDCHCILGQLFGDYYAAELGVSCRDLAYEETAAALGFQATIPAGDGEYDALRDAWRRLITARREARHG